MTAGVLLRLWPVWVALFVALVIAALMRTCYNNGVEDTNAKWEEKEAGYRLERASEIRRIEQEWRARQTATATAYQIELKSLKALQERQMAEIVDETGSTISDAVSSVRDLRSKPNDRMCDCANDHSAADRRRLSTNDSNRSGTTCYATDRLRRKIAQSVAIAQECDREMIRFKALIEACKATPNTAP